MSKYAHKGQILPIVNQMIPIDKETTFHASYDYDLNGFNQGEIVRPFGMQSKLDFDGTSGYIQVNNVAELLHGGQEATIEMWVKKKSVQYGFIQLSGFPSSNGNLYPYQDSMTVYLDIFRTNRLGPITMLSPTTDWHHFAVTAKDGANGWKLYQNGELVYQAAGQPTISTNYYGFEIGRNSGVRYANAIFSDVRVWNKARTQEEIKSNMHKIPKGDEEGLISYHKLKEREGPISFDSSGNGNDGIWSGGIASASGDIVAALRKDEGKFRGAVLMEPYAENLLYDNGVFNGSFNSLTLTPTVTTITPNHRYNIKTNSTGYSIRFRIPLTKLTNGLGYNMSFKYRIITGAHFYMADWSDTSVIRTETDCGDYRFQSAYGTRATYDSTFCFMDFNVSPDTEIEVWDIQLEQRNGATSFINGVRPKGRLQYPVSIINTASYTISCWVKFNHINSDGSHQSIIEVDDAVGGITHRLLVAIEGGKFLALNGGETTQSVATSSIAPAINKWYQLTVTFDGTILKLCIDGVIAASVSSVVPVFKEGATLNIGGHYWSSLNGLIDELRIESRAISLEEVEAWAASGLHYNYLDYSQYVD